MIISGKLRKRVFFLKQINANKNEFGETIESSEIDFSARCEVISKSIVKSVVAEGEQPRIECSLRFRFDRRIQPEHSIRIDDDEFEIQALDNVDGRNRELIIDAVKFI